MGGGLVMHANIVFPLILRDESGALEFYDDVGSLTRALEVPDVLRDTYMVFDSSGRRACLRVARSPQSLFEKIELDISTDAAGPPGELAFYLREYLMRCGDAPDHRGGIDHLLERARRASLARR
jgi:hypothetical protein